MEKNIEKPYMQIEIEHWNTNALGTSFNKKMCCIFLELIIHNCKPIICRFFLSIQVCCRMDKKHLWNW